MTQEKAGTGKTAFPSPFMFTNAVPDMQKLMMLAPHMQAAFMKAAIDQQKGFFAFLGRRCDEDMKLAERIGSATSVGDLYSACLNFYRDAAIQYAAEAGEITQIESRETIEVVHDLEQQQTEAIETISKPRAA
ncbi:MAG: hypothetical protein EP321_13035 [Sphingomonadales bacterium]|nr:MAG: hypothetical protein EP345_13860 [Sphingomonadales bacterium]TNF02691.1 MAG: hypothetical protein EP321_13035 [Sphingomonadales bacterium]